MRGILAQVEQQNPDNKGLVRLWRTTVTEYVPLALSVAKEPRKQQNSLPVFASTEKPGQIRRSFVGAGESDIMIVLTFADLWTLWMTSG